MIVTRNPNGRIEDRAYFSTDAEIKEFLDRSRTGSAEKKRLSTRSPSS
jgi:hypothetical protein